MFFRILPLILTAILLAAHYFRDANLFMVLISLAMPFLLLIRRRRVLIVLQVFCYFAMLVWLITTYDIYQYRVSVNDDWLRMVIILGSVAALALVAGLLLNGSFLKTRYPIGEQSADTVENPEA